MKVYIKTSNNLIIAVNSSAFINDLTDWIEIDQGEGDPYYLAQGNYFPKPIIDDYGVYRYKYINNECIERTQEQMEADRPEPPEPVPTAEEKIAALEDTIQILTDCLLEMSETVYA